MGETNQVFVEEENEEKAGEDPNMMKVLNVKDKQSGRLRAHLVPRKGTKDQPWVAEQVANDFKIFGHSTAIFKSDQESSMKAIHAEIVRIRAPLTTIPEHSPKGDSKANGVIERGNRSTSESKVAPPSLIATSSSPMAWKA